jgi:hypothetical protein
MLRLLSHKVYKTTKSYSKTAPPKVAQTNEAHKAENIEDFPLFLLYLGGFTMFGGATGAAAGGAKGIIECCKEENKKIDFVDHLTLLSSHIIRGLGQGMANGFAFALVWPVVLYIYPISESDPD